MITKWIKYDNNGLIFQISEIEQDGFTKLDLNITENIWISNYYNLIVIGKLIYSNGDLIENPNYEEPINNEVDFQIEKRDFGQRLIAEVMVETGVEGILQVNPQLGMTLMAMTESLFYALNNGFLILAISSIKSIPPANIGDPVNNIINEDLLLKYRNKIHSFLNIEPVQNYND